MISNAETANESLKPSSRSTSPSSPVMTVTILTNIPTNIPTQERVRTMSRTVCLAPLPSSQYIKLFVAMSLLLVLSISLLGVTSCTAVNTTIIPLNESFEDIHCDLDAERTFSIDYYLSGHIHNSVQKACI